jgi:hypothetical protein
MKKPITTDPGNDTPRTITQRRTDTERLLFLLHRGGNYAHLWTDAGNRSYWFSTASLAPAGCRTPQKHRRSKHKQLQQRARLVPKQWLRHNIYFSVHPLSQIPPHNTTGNRDRRFISSQSDYICAVNALFAEFDGKDYVYTDECRSTLPTGFRMLPPLERQQHIKAAKEQLFYQNPASFKQRARHHINALPYPPSVIIDSGGGYHCYWLLRHTVPIDEANRDDVQVIQHSWVQMVDGDKGAADLRRVLRLPGSYNHKAGFGPTAPRVEFVKADFGLLYDYQLLEETVNDWLHENMSREQRHRSMRKRAVPSAAEPSTEAQRSAQEQLRQQFNQQHQIEDLLVPHGYRLCSAQHGQRRLARPGRDRLHASITIFPAHSAGAPERSIHFSTNDPLYSREYIDPRSGKVRRHVHDAFHIYVLLEHGGDWAAAYQAVAQSEAVRAH